MQNHLQTILPTVFPLDALPHYSRRRIELADGDFFDCDYVLSAASDRPALVLFHGLEGDSSSPYARSFTHFFAAQAWSIFVVHFRGCSGEINRLPRMYHSGDALDIADMLRLVRTHFLLTQVYVVGVSLGGNALLGALGQEKLQSFSWLKKAGAISAPLDLMAAGYALEIGLNWMYAQHFLRSMKRKAAQKWQQFPMLFNFSQMKKCKTIREFDDLVTAPLHNFDGVKDYWQRASAKNFLAQITLPTLLVNARNDPFIPFDSVVASVGINSKKNDTFAALDSNHLLNRQAAAKLLNRPAAAKPLWTRSALNPNLSLYFPPMGGHAGFGVTRQQRQLLPKLLFDFFSQD